jgi:hypothetical protein
MDQGEVLVKNDGSDGDGAGGYGYNGTLSWASTWTTAAGTRSTVNAGDNALVYDPYDRQDLAGKLAQITDSVFYGNNFASAYTEAVNRGVLASATVDLSPNGTKGNIITSAFPIQSYTRGALVTKGGKSMLPITSIAPTPAVGVNAGGFGAINWLASWTAVDAYDMTDTSMNPYNGDLNVDGHVDVKDFAILSENWLY